MQSEFLLSDNPKSNNKRTTNHHNNNNTYKILDKKQSNRNKTKTTALSSSGHNYRSSIQQTPRLELESVNGLSADNLPGSSMSVADITLTMSNEDGQNTLCFDHIMTSPLDSGVGAEDSSNASLFPSYPFSPSPSSPQSPSSPVSSCSDPCCNNDRCSWHQCVLKSPHHVRWKPNTVTVELKRSPHFRSFGFYVKAKEHVLSDKKSKELYVLVKEVLPDGPAASAGLAVGDYLRSVNYKALHSTQEYNKFVNSTLKSADKLMMVIQKPDSITVNDFAVLESLSMGKKSTIPLSKPVSPSTSPDAKFSPCSTPNESIPLRNVFRSNPKSHLPQARLIVCGNRTNEFMHCFMGGFIHFPADSNASYHYVSLEKQQNGGSCSSSISVSNSKSFSCMVSESSSSSLSSLDSVNIDIISVASDNFFHHCSPWIFSRDTIFVLTFDVKRLAQFSDAEMARLSALKHTVHASGSGSKNTRLKLVGVVLPGEDVPLEEIRTLFYTSLGETLPGPDFVPVSESSRTKEMQQFQTELFQSVADISARSEVVVPTLNAMDYLISHQNLTINNHELASALINWNNLGSDMELLNIVVDDLKRTGNLVATSHMAQSSTTRDLIIPCKLFDCLVHISMTTERIQIPESGIVPRTQLVDFLSMLTPQPIKLLTCLEDLGVVNSIRVQGRDSGSYEEIGMVFPYLLDEVPPESDLPANGCQDVLTIQLEEPISSSSFHAWLSKLSVHCHRVDAIGPASCQFLIEGLHFTAIWNRVQSHIRLMTKRPTRGHSLSCSPTPTRSQLQRVEDCLLKSLSTLRSPFQLHWSQVALYSHNNNNNRDDGRGGSPVDTGAAFVRLDSIDSTVRDNEQLYVQGQNLIENEPVQTFCRLLGGVGGLDGGTPEVIQWLVDCAIATIPYINGPLQQMHRHLSINHAWESLAASLGKTTKDTGIYTSLISANPNRLPAETFYLRITQETNCSLGNILSGLLSMSAVDVHCLRLAEALMRAALEGYHRHSRNNCKRN